uniref:Terminase large subunit n=1 Tax=Podoviridae sp. ct2m58 TaxID=2827721 RepID=A0A8S5TMI3_9CAUD|nr:MAG TPA: Terminase large subunit [Podoviridae sp. ct2m58]
MDFIDKNTAWAKQRLVSTRMERVAGYKVTDEFGKQTEQGYMSAITGITLKNDPERIRGTRAKLVLWEEGGKFPGLLDAWRIEQPSVELDDGFAFGLQIAFGCVCKGTKVWTSSGNCVNIEDLKQEDGILGWDTYQAVQQHISHFNPPAKKPCVRITTNTGRVLECSTDHPVLWSYSGLTKRVPGKRKENETMKQWKWHEAAKCKVGEQVGIINSIPFFGTKKMWEPRVIGWLIGDGSYGYDKTPRLSNCDDEINEYIETHFDTSPDCPPRLTKNGKVYKETLIKGICPKLRELGIYG